MDTMKAGMTAALTLRPGTEKNSSDFMGTTDKIKHEWYARSG